MFCLRGYYNIIYYQMSCFFFVFLCIVSPLSNYKRNSLPIGHTIGHVPLLFAHFWEPLPFLLLCVALIRLHTLSLFYHTSLKHLTDAVSIVYAPDRFSKERSDRDNLDFVRKRDRLVLHCIGDDQVLDRAAVYALDRAWH
jgi:hypothetical protein